MAFSVPASKRSVKQNRFEFTIDGKKFDIPLMKYLPLSAAEAFENEEPVRGILAACDGDAARDAVRQLDGEQLDALLTAWQEASEVKVGESSAS